MRILCDQHVPTKYIQAFEQESGINVSTVRELLTPDASDDEIVAIAKKDDWVVFTNDDDFFHPEIAHGLVVYSQTDDPSPGDVIAALRAIEDAYASSTDIVEVVPDGWV